MKIGIGIGVGKGGRVDLLRTIAVQADRLNFATLWTAEHVVVFDHYSSQYPYADHFQLPGDTIFNSPLVSLAYAAAITSRIRLGTGMCLVPEYNPLILAKEIATIDSLSRGRMVLGVGIGWSEEEFRALGIAWERRAQRTLEYLEVMRRLWGEERTSFQGEFVKFENARSYPKPFRGARLPIFFGGESDAALRRAAVHGVGWYGANLGPEAAAERVTKLHQLLRARGRKPDEVEVVVAPMTAAKITDDNLKRYRDAGVNEILAGLTLRGDNDDPIKGMEDLARRVVEPAAKLG